MRRILLAVLLLAAAGPGQLVERYVNLADPLTVGRALGLAVNPDVGAVYVAGNDGVVVVDGASMTKCRLLCAGEEVRAVHFSRAAGRLYVLESDAMVVFDGTTCEELRRVTLPASASFLSADPDDNRLLVFHYSDVRALSVFAIGSDSLLRTVALDSINYLSAMAVNPRHDKAYVTDLEPGRMAVVDLAAGVVRGYLEVDDYADVECNPVTDKVYLTGYYRNPRVWVLDGVTDSVVAVVVLDSVLYGDLPYLKVHQGLNKIYVWECEGEGMAVIDGAGDSLLSVVPGVYGIYPDSMVLLDEAGDRLFCQAWSEGTAVVDCRTDSLVRWLEGGLHGRFLALDPRKDRLFVAERYRLWALDCPTGEFAGQVTLANNHDLAWLGADPEAGRLYCHLGILNDLVLVHAPSGRVEARVGLRVEDVFRVIGLNTVRDRVYVAVETSNDGARLVSVSPADSSERVVLSEREGRWLQSAWPVPEQERTLCVLFVNSQNTEYYLVPLDWDTDKLGEPVQLEAGIDGAAFDPGRNRGYIVQDGRLLALDLETYATRLLLDSIAYRCSPVLDPTLGKLYLVQDDLVRIYSIEQDSVTAVTGLGLLHGTGPLACDTVRHLLYCGQGDSVVVIGGEAERAIAVIPAGFEVAGLGWSPASGRVACVGQGWVGFLDWDQQAMAWRAKLGSRCEAWTWDAANGRVYVGLDDTLIAMVRDTTMPAGQAERPPATLVRRFLALELGETGALVDVTGRKLLDLLPGRNDLGAVAPGVYFLRTAGDAEDPTVRKVIIRR